jgi:hypothetical protein
MLIGRWRLQDPEQDRILFDVRDHENLGKSKPLV